MKNSIKRFTVNLLAILLILCFAVPACAEDGGLASDLSGLTAISPEELERQKQEAAEAAAEAERQAAEMRAQILNTATDLTIGYIASESDQLHPLWCSNMNLISTSRLMYECVIDLDEEMKPSPMLADSWTHEGTVWHFKMREGIVFHSGQEMTARDVVASYQALLGAGESNPYYGRISTLIVDMTADSSYELTVTAACEGYIALYGMVFPVMQEASIYTTMPMGTGPFWYAGADDMGLIRLDANPYWWKQQPLIHSILFKRYDEAADALEAQQRGDVEMISSKSSRFALSRKLNDLTSSDFPALTFEMLVPNLSSKSIMSDVLMRQAVMYAVDIGLVASNAYLDMAIQSEVPIPPISWLYDSQSAVYYYSPERAIYLMHEAGWCDLTGNGVMNKEVNQHLEEPSIDLITINEPTSSIRENAAELIAGYLEDVGFIVNVVVCTSYDNLQYRLTHRSFDLALVGVNLSEVPNLYEMFHKGSALNLNGYSNDQMSALLSEVGKAPGAEDLQAVYSEIEKMIVERLPIMGLLFRTGTVLSTRSLNGLRSPRMYNNWNGLEFVPNE